MKENGRQRAHASASKETVCRAAYSKKFCKLQKCEEKGVLSVTIKSAKF